MKFSLSFEDITRLDKIALVVEKSFQNKKKSYSALVELSHQDYDFLHLLCGLVRGDYESLALSMENRYPYNYTIFKARSFDIFRYIKFIREHSL